MPLDKIYDFVVVNEPLKTLNQFTSKFYSVYSKIKPKKQMTSGKRHTKKLEFYPERGVDVCTIRHVV